MRYDEKSVIRHDAMKSVIRHDAMEKIVFVGLFCSLTKLFF